MRQHKVSRSLSLPRMIGGVVRGFAIANGTLTAVLVYITYRAGWQFICGFLALGMVVHMALRWLTNKDPWWKDRKSTRLNSSHIQKSRMPSSA